MVRRGPPKPKLVIRIGVTGHRPNQFSEAGQRVVAKKLAALFDQIAAVAKSVQIREARLFDPAPPQFRIVSALAEGADTVVAEAGLEAGFALDAVLPFAAATYEADFEAEESKRCFRRLLGRARACFALPGAKSGDDGAVADRAYEAVGLITLRQCDLLIAIWNGKESSGRGGTEDIVQRAVESGRPVLWFDPEGRGPYLLYDSDVNPSDARDLAARAAGGATANDADIARVVEAIAAPPRESVGPGRQKAAQIARCRLQRYLGESERRIIVADPWYPLLLSLLTDRKGFWRSFVQPSFLTGTERDWNTYWSALEGADDRIKRPLREILMQSFSWADKLADHYATLYRSSYVRNYLLAALAVLFAALNTPWF